MSEVISIKAEQMCLQAPEIYSKFNQGIMWYNKLTDEHKVVHINSPRILFTIGIWECT